MKDYEVKSLRIGGDFLKVTYTAIHKDEKSNVFSKDEQ